MRSVELNGAEVRTLQNQTTGDKLHVIAARGMIFSSWRPSPEEKALLQMDKPVWVVMRGNMVPEFLLTVGDRNQVVPPEIIKRAQRADVILNSEVGQMVAKQHRRKEWLVEVVAHAYLVVIIAIAAAIGWCIWVAAFSRLYGKVLGG